MTQSTLKHSTEVFAKAPSLIPKMYEHQAYTADFIFDHPATLITSDTGTGKTRAVLEGFRKLKAVGLADHLYVFAPKTIMQPAWGDDIERWTPDLSYSIAYAKNRQQAFEDMADVYITNHDAVKWLNTNANLVHPNSMFCVDEVTAFKHHTSQRSKAIRGLRKQFARRVVMSGTLNSNTITDVWHPVMLIDDGERLGRQFFGFRSQVCSPKQVGPDPRMVQWNDKPGAQETVAMMLDDITVHFNFEDCISIPPHTKTTVYVDLPKKLLKQYEQLEADAVLELSSDMKIDAIHAGAKIKKMLQLLTGAVYDSNHEVGLVHTARYELVTELINEREQCVVAFNWRHERVNLCKLADKEDWEYAVIDGETSDKDRIKAVNDFQTGKVKVIFAHPASAAHGLTLTAGTSTIWASPTYNAEHFKQFNARIYRAGQTRPTETVRIAARDTKELDVYEALDGKISRMEDLMSVFADLTLLNQQE